MIKRVVITLGVAVPSGLLAFFWLFPELDPIWQAPLLHCYLVTFFTFAAVVAAHRGRIWVESQPKQGSTFSFTLPQKL